MRRSRAQPVSAVTAAAGVLAFLGTVFAIHGGIRHIYMDFVEASAEARRTMEDRARAADPCDVVFAGNSHTFAACRMDVVPRSTTIASLGEPYLCTYYKLRYFLSRRPTPVRAVVLQLDLHSFGDAKRDATKVYQWAPYLDYVDIALFRRDPWPIFKDWVAFDFVPYAGKSKDAWSYWHTARPSTREIMDRAFDRRFSESDNPLRDAFLSAKEHLATTAWYDMESEYFFEKIVKLCGDRGTTLVWVRLPVTREYYEQAITMFPAGEWRRKVDEKVRAHAGVMFLDAHDMFFDENDLFADANHLNYAGSERFSIWLYQQLVERRVLPPG